VNIRVAINQRRLFFPWLLGARVAGQAGEQAAASVHAEAAAIPSGEIFHAVLLLERRRAERSKKPFVLVLFDAHQENGTARGILHQTFSVLGRATRETDSLGWYKEGMVLGLICTEVGDGDQRAAVPVLETKLRTILEEKLGPETAGKIKMSLHVFPEHWDRDDSGWSATSALYPEWPAQAESKSARAIRAELTVYPKRRM